MEIDMPIISIIVPVYNVEQYLPRCIESILAQTFTDFELLLIDDGSLDKCGKICDEYAKKDARIRVFHKENGGVSSARNMGLDNARGAYIGFVDADDFINSEMYDILYRGYHSGEEVQLSSCGILFEGKKYVPMKDGNNEVHFVSKEKIVSSIFGTENCLRINIVNKLFKKDIIGSLHFDNFYKIAEDVLFLANYITKINNVSFQYYPGYVRTYREGSATLGGTEDKSISIIPFTLDTIIKTVCKEYDERKTMYYWGVNETIVWINRCNKNKKMTTAMIKNAWPIRIKALFVNTINIKVRILFFIGYYGLRYGALSHK